MKLYTFFILSIILLIFVVSGCLCYRFLIRKEKRISKFFYLIPFPFFVISIGLFIPMLNNFSEEEKLKEWMFPEEIELPYWNTVEDIDFKQWKSVEYFQGDYSYSIDFLYDAIEEPYSRKPVIEILLSENHQEITNINFSILSSRAKSSKEKPIERALYESVYTGDRFYLKRKEIIKIDSYFVDSVSFFNFLNLSLLIREGDIPNAVSEKTDMIHICYQEASPRMRFTGQWITAINQKGEEKSLVLSSLLFDIIPTTYLQVEVYDNTEDSLIYFVDPPYMNFDEFMKFAEYIATTHP